MNPNFWCKNTNFTVFVLGLMTLLLMQGCQGFRPVDPANGPAGEGGVNVKTYVIEGCADGTLQNVLEEDIPAPGGCYARSYTGSAVGFWNAVDNVVIQPGGTETCSGSSKKCKNPGSMCNGTGGVDYCYSTWTGPGNCICACGQL